MNLFNVSDVFSVKRPTYCIIPVSVSIVTLLKILDIKRGENNHGITMTVLEYIVVLLKTYNF